MTRQPPSLFPGFLAARTPGAFLAAVALVGACDSPMPHGIAGPWESERIESGDTVLVRTISGSVWGDTMVLVPEVAIGMLEGEAAYVLGMPHAVDVDRNGRIYVADRQAREVRVFDSDGRHRFSFGREGQGPGEFMGPDDVHVTTDGHVLVRDQAGARFSVFTNDGRFLRSFPLRGGFSTTELSYLDDRGNVLIPVVLDFATLPWDWAWAVHSLNDGIALDTIPIPLPTHVEPRIEASGATGFIYQAVPFAARTFWAASPEGDVILAVSDRLRWARLKGGRRVFAAERLDAQAPVLTAEAQAEVDRITRQFRQVYPDWRWDGPSIPSEKAYFQDLATGSDGSIWLRRHVRAREVPNPAWSPASRESTPRTVWQEEIVMDVFDRDGRYMGPVRFPNEMAPYRRGRFSLDRVVLVTVHRHGHEQVVVYRPEPRSSP